MSAILRTREELQVVGEAGDGIEAVQRARELQPDLILLDIGLPKLNGIEAASRIHHVVPGVKIFFVTQHTDPDVVRAALSNGAKAYLFKADAASELLPAIGAVLRGEVFVSHNIKR